MFRIEHALVMDTDHLPGGGGYAVAGVSPGVKEPERVFVSENFGISDFLHDPENKNSHYFSVLRVPGGRTAFVRRFAKGTRRGGTQNRIFVHTLFLDDDLLAELHYLPWILLDRPLRLGQNEIYLTVHPEPLLDPSVFPALEWSGGITDDDAFEQIRLRHQQFGKRFAQSPEYGGVDGFDAVAAVMEALRRNGRAVLPQGALFEQLSLLAWSMLPPPDRLSLPWTQHDGGNTATTFAVANAETPGNGAFVDFHAHVSEPAHRTVELNTKSLKSWADFHSTTARLGISLRAGDLEWWLKWRDSLEALKANPLAPDAELIPKLNRVAESIRPGRRDAWVDELEVLRFLLDVINSAIDKGQAGETAVRRWNSLFQRTNIADLVFRQPPPPEWLDDSEKRIGPDLVAECFMAGSEQLRSAAGTRATVARWLLEGRRLEKVPVPTVGRLIERLAEDSSPLAGDLIDATLPRPRALRELADVLPSRKRALGATILDIVVSAMQRRDADAGWFAEAMLLPQLELNPALSQNIGRKDAEAVGSALREKPESYARFAARMQPGVAAVLIAQLETWLGSDRRISIPIARQILERVNRRDFPAVAVEKIAFTAAEAGEPTRLWFPAAIDFAAMLDVGNDATETQRFSARVQNLAQRAKREDRDAVRQVVAALRQFASEQRRTGACLRDLVKFTRPSWLSAGDALPEALQAAISAGSARASEWSGVVADLMKMHGRDGYLSLAVANLLKAFWERLTATDFGAVPDSLIDGLAFLDQESGTRVVTRWLVSVRALPAIKTADRFLDALGTIASDAQFSELEVERSWRAIEHNVADSGTLQRLDSALPLTAKKKKDRDIPAAIAHMVQRLPATDRAAWLVQIAAADNTPPSTRRIIETRFFPAALQRLLGTDWSEFLNLAGDDLFAYGNVRLTAARELALANPSTAVRNQFEKACRAQYREEAIKGVDGAKPRGIIEQMSNWWRGDLRA